MSHTVQFHGLPAITVSMVGLMDRRLDCHAKSSRFESPFLYKRNLVLLGKFRHQYGCKGDAVVDRTEC